MEQDLGIGRCLSDAKRYADLLNGLLFEGRQKVRAEDLQDTDPRSFLKETGRKRKKYFRSLCRDLIRKTAFGVNFALIGVENQVLVHYLMPLRTMEYDLAEYEKQAAKIRKQISKAREISSAEFLSGFRKEDKLHPCITIVLYYGNEWNGADSLHGVLDFTDIPIELKKYVNDYPLHIFSISRLENLERFQTDLKQIFQFLKYAKDKTKLKELVANDRTYQELAEEAYDMIAVCTHAEELIAVKKNYEKGDKVDMCQAIKEMLEDERMLGLEEGKEQVLLLLVAKKICKNKTLDMIAEDLEEDIEVIRPIYEKAKKQVKERSGNR